MTTLDKLLPCPFCGEEKELREHRDREESTRWEGVYVRCDNCGAIGPECDTWPKARAAWNKRGN